MVGKEGFISLYKGLGPTLWRDVPFSGLYWAGFEVLKRKLKRRGYDGTGVTFISGAVSGTVGGVMSVCHLRDADHTFPFRLLQCSPRRSTY